MTSRHGRRDAEGENRMKMEDLGKEQKRFFYNGHPKRVLSFHLEGGTVGLVFEEQPKTIFVKSGIAEFNPVSKVDDDDWRQIVAL